MSLSRAGSLHVGRFGKQVKAALGARLAVAIALVGIPGRLPEAISEFQAALKLQPNSAEAHSNFGLALSRAPGRMPEAIAEFEAAFRIKPDPAIRQTIDNLRAGLGK